MTKSETKTLTFTNFMKGFAPLAAAYGATQFNIPFDHERFGASTAGINPYRFPNTISPEPAKTSATNESVITDVPKNIAVRNISTGEAYMIGSGDGSTGGSVKLYKVTGTTFSTVVDNSPTTPTLPHAISGMKNGYDCLIGTVNGTDYLFYTFDDGNTAGVGKTVGIWNFSTNWTSANAAQAGWGSLSGNSSDPYLAFLPIVQGDDGNIYIGSGDNVDKITTTAAVASAFSNNAVQVPSNYVITTMRPYKSYLAIGAVQKQTLSSDTFNGKSAVFFWNYAKATFDNIIYLDDNKLGSLFVKDGILYAFTGKRDGYSKLKMFTGQSFKTLAEFTGSPPVHNNPDVYKDMLIWTANNSAWTYGSPNEALPVALNCVENNVTGFAKA